MGSNKKRSRKKSAGFTLIEILVVVIILGVLSVLITGNFVNSLKKGRDARRKSDLEQIRNAIEMYYEDNKAYPPADKVPFSGQLVHPVVGKIYMQRIPNDPQYDSGNANSPSYKYCTNSGITYQLYAAIENGNDPQKISPGYIGTCSSPKCGGKDCNYGIADPNTTP